MMEINTKYKVYLVKFQYVMLFLTILALPIFDLTKRLQFFHLGSKLSWYFALLGLIALGFEWMFFRFEVDRTSKKFLIIFVGWQILVLFFGLYQYPYYQEIDWHASAQLGQVIGLMVNHHLDFFTIPQVEAVWLAIRVIKNTLLNFIFTFGITVWIIHLFKNSFDHGFSTIRKFVLILAITLGIYAIPEILLFKFKMSIGYDILSMTNGFLYDVGSHLDWYPPLVWQGEQVRSYCTEPSIVGFLAATIIPLLWSYFGKSLKLTVFYIYYIMIVFMSKSRTSNAIVIFDFLFLLPGILQAKTRRLAIMLFILSGIGFMCNLGMNFIPPFFFQNVDSSVQEETAYSYYENNVKSIVEKDSRSNGSRLINIVGHANVIKEHWIVGVGEGLEACYVRDNLPDGALDNKEIDSITVQLNEKGPLGMISYGNVNNYVYIMTNEGIVGLIIYLVPFLYILWMIFKMKLWKDHRYVFLSIALIGNLVAEMAGEPVMLLYIILGLLYVGIQENCSFDAKKM